MTGGLWLVVYLAFLLGCDLKKLCTLGWVCGFVQTF